MNLKDYEKQKVKNLTARECTWKLFTLTGQINYYLLHSAIENEGKKEHLWRSTKSPEL